MAAKIKREVYQAYERFTVYNFYKVTKSSDGVINKQFLYRSTYFLNEIK